MRAAALKRMQALRISKTFAWADARDVQLTDEVRFLIRDGDQTLPVQGHVTEIVRKVEGGGVASVDVNDRRVRRVRAGRDDLRRRRGLRGGGLLVGDVTPRRTRASTSPTRPGWPRTGAPGSGTSSTP